MDSLATLNVPAIGYGLRYEFGIFDQVDPGRLAGRDHRQVAPIREPLGDRAPGDHVRREARRTHRALSRRAGPVSACAGFRTGSSKGSRTTPPSRATGADDQLLRLWKAEAAESFDFDAFNAGDYYRAVDQKVESETISKVLYPNDEPDAGKKLRLAQQHFFVSCSLQDMIRLHLARQKSLADFDAYWAVQLNDTHPSIAVAELMRLLVDEHMMDWDEAWAITQQACGYTNHTLLAGGAREVARAALRQAAAAAPGNHLRDQSAFPGRRAPRIPATTTCSGGSR